MRIENRNEEVAAVISLTELGYPTPSWADARALVETLNRDSAFIVLAQFNLFLAVASIQSYQNRDLGVRRWAQERLISSIISETRLREIRQAVGGEADLLDRILVHRSLVMAALRLVAAHAQTEGGNKLEKREDFDILGELALVINGVTEREPTCQLTPCDIAAQLAPSRELENHPDLGLTLARVERLLSVHLPRHLNTESAQRAEQVFTFVTNGFSFESFRDMTFAMFAYYSTLDLETVLKDQGITYLNPHNPASAVNAEILEKFLGLMSVDIDHVPAFLADGVPDERLLLDFTRFRERPFWRFRDGAYLCIDAAFVMEKLAEGAYWWLMEGQGPKDDPESDERRGQFSALWGYLFEDYVDEHLRHAHNGREEALHPHPFYSRPNEEAFDDVVVEGTDFVAIQCKSALLPIAAKYAGTCRPFVEGLNALFGTEPRAAIEQLIRNCAFTFGLGGERRTLRGLSVDAIRKVYPVAIVQEPILGFWLAAKLLVEPFVRQVATMAWRLDVEIRPVVFMTIEELETIAAHINAREFTLVELLREKLGTDRDHMQSVDQFLNLKFLPSRGLKPRRNEFVAAILQATKDGWMKRWESGVYS